MVSHYEGKDILTGRHVKPPPMPFVWGLVRNCLELPDGKLRHFPAGTYNAQVEHWTGEVELELMRIVHSAWYTFGYRKKSEWKEADVSLFNDLRKTPKIPPSHRWENFVLYVWGISDWVYQVIESLKNRSVEQ